MVANRVSSLPQPTFSPGLIFVPRCRTMMDPLGMYCPPKTLMPSRCAHESRPFLELPKPFLCAMTISHSWLQLSNDIANADLRIILPVTLRPLVLFLAL